MEQQMQLLLNLLRATEMGLEAGENWLHQHTALAVANIIVAPRFQECVRKQEARAGVDDLLAHPSDQPLAGVLHDFWLEGKDGSPLAALDQAAPTQRLDSQQDLAPGYDVE